MKVVGRAISKSLDGPWVYATSIGEQAVDYLYENYGYGEYSSSSVSQVLYLNGMLALAVVSALYGL